MIPAEDEEYVSNVVKGYYIQITQGCDKLSCNIQECCSCPNFNIKFNSPNEAAFHSLKLTFSHASRPKLCTGQSPYKHDSSVREKVEKFNDVINILMNDENHNMSEQYICNIIHSVLTDKQCFPFILKPVNRDFRDQNLGLDEDVIRRFMIFLTNNEKFFTYSFKYFLSMLSDFLAVDDCDTYFHLRGLILVFVFDIFFEPSNFETTIVSLITHINRLPQLASDKFYATLVNLPVLFKHVFSVTQSQLSMFVLSVKSIKPFHEKLYHVTTLLQYLRSASYQLNIHIPSSRFSNNPLTNRLNPTYQYEAYDRGMISFLMTPVALTIKFKHDVLVYVQKQKQEESATNELRQRIYYYGTDGINDINNSILYNILEVRREKLVEDAIRKIPAMQPSDLSRKLMVVFSGEQAIDQGGVSREFFQLLCNSIFSEDFGMFVNYGNFYWFSLHANVDLDKYTMIGTVVSLAIYNNVTLPVRFPHLLYKKILKRPIRLKDLYELDPGFVSSASEMLKIRENGEDVSELMICFTASVLQQGKYIDIELCSKGRDTIVTNENLDDYIDKYIKILTDSSIHEQFRAFYEGFEKLFVRPLYMLFEPDEFDILVSGEIIYDWVAFKANARYSDGYKSDSEEIIWFWEIFDEMSNKQKIDFLRFSTGSDRVHIGGLGDMKLVIQRSEDVSKLPVSHTCFNIFTLPAYPSKSIMQSKILLAIEHSEGFGIV